MFNTSVSDPLSCLDRSQVLLLQNVCCITEKNYLAGTNNPHVSCEFCDGHPAEDYKSIDGNIQHILFQYKLISMYALKKVFSSENTLL